MKLKISIITINYNNLEGLKKTVESVTSQSWKEFEYIVIDGGSTDGSVEYLESQSKNINYWISEPDKGVYQAMNKGIQKASGEYLLFLNSGDHFYNKNVLQKNIVHVNNYDLIYFNQYVIGENKKFIKYYPDRLSFAYFLKDNLPHQATFIKRKLFTKYGLFSEDFKIVSDYKFFIDCICKYQVSYLYMDKVLTVFYLGGMSSLLENRGILSKEKLEVLNAEYSPYLRDLEEVLEYKTIINSLRRSRIIRGLIKLRLLNKF